MPSRQVSKSKATPSPKKKSAKKSRNEVTGKRIASIAGKVLQALEGQPDGFRIHIGLNGLETMRIGELKALAASALTQSADKPRATGRAGK